jgi:hypothetical protein
MAASTESTHDLRPRRLALAIFAMVFFLAPLHSLYVSLHADESMKALGFTQYAKFLLDPFSQVLGHTLWIGVA